MSAEKVHFFSVFQKAICNKLKHATGHGVCALQGLIECWSAKNTSELADRALSCHQRKGRRFVGRSNVDTYLADRDSLIDVSPATLIAIRAVGCLVNINFGAYDVVAWR